MNLENRIEQLEHTVYGNGSPGMKTEMAVMKENLQELPFIKSRLAKVERAIYLAAGGLALVELYLRITGK